MLVPEIGLTPQLLQQFPKAPADFHIGTALESGGR